MYPTRKALTESIRAQCVKALSEHAFAVSGTLATFGRSIHHIVGSVTNFREADTAYMPTHTSRESDRQLTVVESDIHPE